MFKVNSQRAKALLDSPRFFLKDADLSQMKRFPSDRLNLWARMQLENQIVKNLSFAGTLEEGPLLVLESMASLLIGKNISLLGELSLRECEAFLRDRNSQVAYEGLDSDDENELKRFFLWLRHLTSDLAIKEYHFHSQKGPFKGLTLVDKVRELKAFLNSPEIASLYQGRSRPELIDVEDLTIYLEAPYQDEADRILFERLHELGVETFEEESLNFIPEA